MSEYDDDYYDEEDDEPEVTYSSDTRPALDFRIRQKIIDLQDQLIKHFTNEQLLNETDLVRYTAMVEVLKAVLQ
jgi:hypothetical protein